MRVMLAALLAASLLAGCSKGGGALSEDEARDVAEEALAQFARDFTSDDSDIRRVEGEFEVEESEFGAAEVTFTMERGRDDALHIEMEMGGGGISFSLEMYCDPQREIVIFAGESYESRPSLEEPCLGSDLQADGPIDVSELDETELEDVRAHGDGSVTATFTNETGEFTIKVDPDGRLVRIEIEADEGSGTFDIDYGSRREIDFPEADERMPADLVYDINFEGEDEVWTIEGSPQRPPISDFEMRFQDGDEVVANVTLQEGVQIAGDYRFTFEDADDDGHLSAGDVLTFRAPAGSSTTAVLYDRWAGVNVGEGNLLPGFGWLGAVAALGLVALARRRLAQ